MKRVAIAVLLLGLLGVAACGQRDGPLPPAVPEGVLEWSTPRVGGSAGDPSRPQLKPFRYWRAEFHPDHTFRIAWQATGAGEWTEIRGTWREPAEEPWARGKDMWVLTPDSGPKTHAPDGTGRDLPVLWWCPASERPDGSRGPTWWLSIVDPATGRFTNLMDLHLETR